MGKGWMVFFPHSCPGSLPSNTSHTFFERPKRKRFVSVHKWRGEGQSSFYAVLDTTQASKII